jgi:diguanylate cyclase (GGDEF)-like protein/PAS domain S-box-containing protein
METQRSAVARPGRPLVLVVDDEQAWSELCREVLDDAADVQLATTIRRALELAAVRAPDAVVLDLGLADSCGLSGLQAFKLAHPLVPVVVLTGNADPDVVAAARQGGADDFVHKDALDQLPHAVLFAMSRSLARHVMQHGDQVLDVLPDGVVVLDKGGRAISYNPAALDILGLTGQRGPERLDGHELTWVDAAGTALAGALPWAAALHGAGVEGIQLGCRRADGSLRWLTVDARALSGDQGDVLAVVVCLRDVTEQHAAQAGLAFQAALLDAVGQAVVATDVAGVIRYWNRAAEALYGWTAQQAVGRPVGELIVPEASQEVANEIMLALRAGLPWSGDFPVRRRDGSSFYALVSNTPLHGPDGQVEGIIGVSTDISARREAELQGRRLAALVDSTGDAVVLKSLDGTIVSWNRAAEHLYGWTADEAVGQHVSLISAGDREDETRHILAEVARGETVHDVETQRRRRDGTLVEVSVTVSPVYDESGAVTAASTIARDITERRAMQRALERAALHDSLTDLPNRTLLTDRLEQASAICDRDGQPLALLFIDLDDFKSVNDGAGHVLGDALLVHVARLLVANVRPGDTVARFGGDEFVVLCPGAGRVKALEIAERLLAAVRAPFDCDGRRLYVSASIGLALSPPSPAGTLLQRADASVYDAKARGRGQVVEYVSTLSEQAEQRLVLSGDLREALADGDLRLEYQPIIDLASGAVLGVEALVRWDHPVHGPIPPNVFVPVAEQTGFARELDGWVARQACAEFAALRRDGVVGPDVYVSVNVAADTVVDRSFEDAVLEALHDAGLPPTTLVVEVTETGMVADLDAAVQTLTALTVHGIRVAIDDFGTGWSSLTYVRRLPASILKLDRTFVARVHQDSDDLAIAASVIDLGRATGLTVVAEGVEVQEQLDVLRRLRCAAGQGWLWHRSVRSSELAEALAGLSRRVVDSAAEAPVPVVRQSAAVLREHGLERLQSLHAEGASLATVAAALNKEGFRTPAGQRWHARSVARVVASTALHQLDPLR